MKKFIALIMVALFTMTTSFAQSAADKIVGTYSAVQNGVNSKIKIFKLKDGSYRAQVTWVDNLKMPDGTTRTDMKNPDKSKRNVPANQIVLIESIKYVDGVWKEGKVYDPTRGKTFKVECSFKDSKTLTVKGSLGPFYEKVYWTKTN